MKRRGIKKRKAIEGRLDPNTADPLDILIAQEERKAHEESADRVMEEAIQKVGGTTE